MSTLSAASTAADLHNGHINGLNGVAQQQQQQPLPATAGSNGTVAAMNGRSKLSKSPSADSLQSATSSNSAGGASGASHEFNGFTPEQAVRNFGSKLSSYEHQEIYNYPRVYFVGSHAKKRQGLVGSTNNNGYDDENGTYLLVAHDHIGYRYEVLKVIGKGSFGQVILKCENA